MSEVIKHSLIADSDLLGKIEQGNWRREEGTLLTSMPELQALVAQAIQVKIRIIQEDPFDKGRRAVLNLGHTFAHAIEQTSKYTISHGEAVAIGLVAAANLSVRLGFCNLDVQQRIEKVIGNVSLPIRIPAAINHSNLMKIMGYDKKKTAGQQRFILIREIGDVFMSEAVSPGAVVETVEAVSE
jgi:3-dehydroquinate synthetase